MTVYPKKKWRVGRDVVCTELTSHNLGHINFSNQIRDSSPSPEPSTLNRIWILQLSFLTPGFHLSRAFQ